MKNVMLTLAVVFAMASCGSKPSIEGAWGATTPCGKQQGISFEKDGVAKSCQFKGMKLEGWKQEGNLLILSGQRVAAPASCATDSTKAECSGEKQECCKEAGKAECDSTKAVGQEGCCATQQPEFVAFSDTLTIVKLTDKELVLTFPCGKEVTFTRLEGCPDAKCSKEGKAEGCDSKKEGCCQKEGKQGCTEAADGKKECEKSEKGSKTTAEGGKESACCDKKHS